MPILVGAIMMPMNKACWDSKEKALAKIYGTSIQNDQLFVHVYLKSDEIEGLLNFYEIEYNNPNHTKYTSTYIEDKRNYEFLHRYFFLELLY